MNLAASTRALLIALGALTHSAGASDASPSESTRTQASRVRASEAQVAEDVALEERLAREWGLTADEWARYRELMRGPLGVYSPNLDPLTALGIEARSSEERRRIAELQVRAEARRAEKTLAYQRAYDEAWKRLFPALSPLRTVLPQLSGHTDGREAGRIAVFVKENCPACDQRVRQLQSAGRAFDLYLVGSRHEDARVRAWAHHAGIDPANVRSQAITLNHDAGRWLSIGGRGELPAVLREVNGRWQRE